MLENFKTNQFKTTQSGFFGASQANTLALNYLKKKVIFVDYIRLYTTNEDFIADIYGLKEINPNLKIELFSRITYDDTNFIGDNFFKFYQLQKWYNQEKKQIVILDNQFINTNSSDPLLRLLTNIIEDKWLNLQLIFIHKKINEVNHRLSRKLDHYFINRYHKRKPRKKPKKKEKYDMCSLTRHFRFNRYNKEIEEPTITFHFDKNKNIKHCDQYLSERIE